MEECEIEVLESNPNWEKELAVPVELRTAQVPVQQIIINNQIQEIMGDCIILVCPKCGNIIQQFQPGIPTIEITKALEATDENDLRKTFYCRKCRQKLQIMRPAHVEAEYEN